jgi:hypothetical protein
MKTNNMKAVLISMSLALGASVNAAVVTITPFTTETLTNYVEASTISSTLTSQGINVNRTMVPGDIFTYTFNSPLNLTSYVSSPSAGLVDLGIGINSTSGAQISFTVDLYGQGAGDPGIVQSFTAFTPLALNTPTFVALQANTPLNIDWANNVIAIGITFNGDTAINTTFGALQVNAIPEPSSASLLAVGVAGLLALRARRKS